MLKIVWRADKHYWKWGWLGSWYGSYDCKLIYLWRIGIGPLQIRWRV